MLTPKKTRISRWMRPFLQNLRQFPSVTEACRAAKVSRQRAYIARRNYPQFASDWDDALQEGLEALEGEAIRRAMVGEERIRPHFHNGRLIYEEVIKDKSDTLLIFLLKAHNPSKYRDGWKQYLKASSPENMFSLGCLSKETLRAVYEDYMEYKRKQEEIV